MGACPQEVTRGVFRIDQRGQDAAVALGVYLVESGFQHRARIVPYLMRLLRGLLKADFVEEIRYDPDDRVPVRERFCFLLHTVLSDAAYHCDELCEEIGNCQMDFLGALVRICSSAHVASVGSPDPSGPAAALSLKVSCLIEGLMLMATDSLPPTDQDAHPHSHSGDSSARTYVQGVRPWSICPGAYAQGVYTAFGDVPRDGNGGMSLVYQAYICKRLFHRCHQLVCPYDIYELMAGCWGTVA